MNHQLITGIGIGSGILMLESFVLLHLGETSKNQQRFLFVLGLFGILGAIFIPITMKQHGYKFRRLSHIERPLMQGILAIFVILVCINAILLGLYIRHRMQVNAQQDDEEDDETLQQSNVNVAKTNIEAAPKPQKSSEETTGSPKPQKSSKETTEAPKPQKSSEEATGSPKTQKSSVTSLSSISSLRCFLI